MPTNTKRPDTKRLNDSQEMFCRNIVNGMVPEKAYQMAYPKSRNWPLKTFKTNMQKVANNPKVIARIEHLTNNHTGKTLEVLWNKEIATRELLKIVHGSTEEAPTNRDLITAISELNRLHELYKPENGVGDFAQLIINARYRVSSEPKIIEGEHVKHVEPH